ncbi:MAG: MaoC family dehydratase N-terminal domain-containing protein [Chloroflexi bacterium]|nr:MaoC family dehydratase N-terminal domain-containing protein [Chloroflexota bacterium]
MAKKDLLYNEIEVGQVFTGPAYTLTKESIDKYINAVEETNPIYGEDKAAKEAGLAEAIAPPTTVAIFTRPSFVLSPEGKLPPGSIHAKQEFEFLGLIRSGDTLTTTGKVVDKYIRRERNYLVIQTTTVNQRGEVVSVGKITGIWP